MTIYFKLTERIGLDVFEIGDKLSEDQVRKILLMADDKSLFQVTKYHDDFTGSHAPYTLLEPLNGEEWLNKHL